MKQIKKILCVTDLSAVSRNAEYASLRLAQAFNAHLTVLGCGEYYSHTPNNYFDENVIQPQENTIFTEEYLKFTEQRRREINDHFKKNIETIEVNLPHEIDYQMRLENEVTATMDLFEERRGQFDLVVVGKQKGNFWERFLFGVPAKEISDEIKISTLLIPESERWAHWVPKQILMASALNQSSVFAEEVATAFASCFRAKLILSHVVDAVNLQVEMNISHIFPIDYLPSQIPSENMDEIKKQKSEELVKLKVRLEKDYHFRKIETTIEFGSVGETLLHLLHEHTGTNLLVMGSRGQNALKKFFLGSNTDTLEETCSIPLLIAQHSP